MANASISFFLQCSENGSILRTFWHSPACLISAYQKNLKELFAANERSKLEAFLQESFAGRQELFHQGTFRLLSPETDISIFIMKYSDRLLVHGLDSYLFKNDITGAALTETVQSFMKLVRIADKSLLTENEVMIGTQFEHIQKLNSNLLNMQRELKKAYARLDVLNKELNNRLVKDALTGLVSRYQYRDEIQGIIARDPKKLGVFAFIDLDDFKKINDNYGHKSGDTYLKTFAHRLLKLPFKNLVCMRIAGDEFGLYIHGYEAFETEDAQAIWQNIEAVVLKEPICLDNARVPVCCSVGLSVYGKDTEDIFELIDYADFAMYQAKNIGKNQYREFDMRLFKEKKQSRQSKA